MAWSEEMSIVWSEEPGVEGTLFLIFSMKASKTSLSIMVGLRGGDDGVSVSSGKAHISGVVRVIEEGAKKIESEEYS